MFCNKGPKDLCECVVEVVAMEEVAVMVMVMRTRMMMAT